MYSMRWHQWVLDLLGNPSGSHSFVAPRGSLMSISLVLSRLPLHRHGRQNLLQRQGSQSLFSRASPLKPAPFRRMYCRGPIS